jgi:hypothetical protein
MMLWLIDKALWLLAWGGMIAFLGVCVWCVAFYVTLRARAGTLVTQEELQQTQSLRRWTLYALIGSIVLMFLGMGAYALYLPYYQEEKAKELNVRFGPVVEELAPALKASEPKDWDPNQFPKDQKYVLWELKAQKLAPEYYKLRDRAQGDADDKEVLLCVLETRAKEYDELAHVVEWPEKKLVGTYKLRANYGLVSGRALIVNHLQ